MDGHHRKSITLGKDSTNLEARNTKQDTINHEERNVVPVESLESSSKNSSVDPDKDGSSNANSSEYRATTENPDWHLFSPLFRADE